jgi:hypothetical protein
MSLNDPKWVLVTQDEFNDPKWFLVIFLSSHDLFWVFNDLNQLFPPWVNPNDIDKVLVGDINTERW